MFLKLHIDLSAASAHTHMTLKADIPDSEENATSLWHPSQSLPLRSEPNLVEVICRSRCDKIDILLDFSPRCFGGLIKHILGSIRMMTPC